MAHTIEDQTLALAGIIQACLLVRELAYQGQAPAHVLAASLASIFRIDAPNVPAVYGEVGRLGEGLRHLRKQLAGQTGNQDIEVTRHALTLIQLAGQLLRLPDMQQQLGQGLQALEAKQRELGPDSPEVIEGLAGIYQRTISTLSPKVIVNGNPQQLNRPEVAQRIRAALLAGIRSAVLWHQCGGSRLSLIFRRKRFLEAADGLLRGGIRLVDEA
ncbi:MAG: high frequency lysogenization protein HflD [Halothiobacillaceae bacterium]|jgi:high frequency lysogenization protein